MAHGLTSSDLLAVLGSAGFGALREFLPRQRWFAAKARGIGAVRVEDWAVLDAQGPLLLVLLDVDGDRYSLPVGVAGDDRGEAIVRTGSGAIIDAHWDPAWCPTLLRAIETGREVAGARGRFVGRPILPWAGPDSARVASIDSRLLSGEQSNTSIAIGRELILKSFRRPRPGINPEIEITRFLTEHTAFRHSPSLVGWMDYVDAHGGAAAVAVVQGFVVNSGDGWRHALAELRRDLDLLPSLERPGATVPDARCGDALIDDIEGLGAVTGGLHAALASDASEPAFAPEPVTSEDRRRWAAEIVAAVGRLASIDGAARADERLTHTLRDLAGDTGTLMRTISGDLDLLASAGAHKIRCHGDYHLGQVLKTPDAFAVIDFEGEPLRSLEQRRAKQSPLRDVAGMLRSFNYAAQSALIDRPEAERPRAASWLEDWERRARHAFLDGYAAAVASSRVPLAPRSRRHLARACAPFEIDKACYELAYELDNRPAWVQIPLAGLTRLLTRH